MRREQCMRQLLKEGADVVHTQESLQQSSNAFLCSLHSRGTAGPEFWLTARLFYTLEVFVALLQTIKAFIKGLLATQCYALKLICKFRT